jgi:cytochrome c peroxidase
MMVCLIFADMRQTIFFLLTIPVMLLIHSFSQENLRDQYAKTPAEWPAPLIDEGVQWTELGPLPASPLAGKEDSLRDIIQLGKVLFFDPRLSASGKISCASCHQPQLNWTDGKAKAVGHEGAMTKRNSPSIANTWFYRRLFWDGRSRDLQDQAFAPIISESEMASDMPDVMIRLRRNQNYRELFKKAYGDDQIDPDRMTGAIALFEKTVISRKSRFDQFLEGDRKALTNAELRGLHLFRTKARCMNCHHGPLTTDNQFHRTGFSGDDVGYYKLTHLDADSGKFKTPSLRDVMQTGPWMHDGMQPDMPAILEAFNRADQPGIRNKLIKPLGLTKKEKSDLLAFLRAISAPAVDFLPPVLPE